MIAEMRTLRIKNTQRYGITGFTLVEMAVVLVIIGLLLVAGLNLGTTQIELARIKSTKEEQESIKFSLINFIARNKRLPCPAIATLAPNAVGYGIEAITPGTCTGTTVTGNVSTGLIPWVSLGLPDSNASDGNYNRFTYQVAIAATNTNVQTISGLKGVISIHTNAPAVLGATPAGNQTNICTVGNYNPCLAVVAIISHGTNGLGAFTSSGTRIVLPAVGSDEEENTNLDNKIVVKEYSNNAANPFDDIVMSLTASDLLSPLTTKGSLDDYNAAINQKYSDMTGAIIANAVTLRTGSPGSYVYPTPVVLPVLPATTIADPWGNAIVYTQVTPSVNSATNASNVAFTLASNGPDGVVGTADDIVKTIFVAQLKSAYSTAGW